VGLEKEGTTAFLLSRSDYGRLGVGEGVKTGRGAFSNLRSSGYDVRRNNFISTLVLTDVLGTEHFASQPKLHGLARHDAISLAH
jgi:hypothetical protein